MRKFWKTPNRVDEIESLKKRILDLESKLANAEMNMSAVNLDEEGRIKNFANLLQPFETSLRLERIGGPHDGGYLIADKHEIKNVISFGVGSEYSADLELLKMGASIKAFDPFVECPAELASYIKYEFCKIGVSSANYEDENGLAFKSFESILKANDSPIDLLMIDIEGEEWNLFDISKENLSNIKQIVLELHDLDKIIDSLFYESAMNKLSQLLDEFTVVHIHANNAGKVLNLKNFRWPSIVELTLLNNSHFKPCLKSTPIKHNLPTKLDYPNDISRPDIDISKIWNTAR